MPDMKGDGSDHEAPIEAQRHDHWGGLLQNEYGRMLGRMEAVQGQILSAIGELKSEGRGRDQALQQTNKSLQQIEDRVQRNAHKANNDLQLLSGRVEIAQVSINTTKGLVEQIGMQVSGLDKRVAHLEAPVNEAILQRDLRRAKWKKYWFWIAGAGVFFWGGFEPIYRALAPIALQRWFSLNLPGP